MTRRASARAGECPDETDESLDILTWVAVFHPVSDIGKQERNPAF